MATSRLTFKEKAAALRSSTPCATAETRRSGGVVLSSSHPASAAKRVMTSKKARLGREDGDVVYDPTLLGTASLSSPFEGDARGLDPEEEAEEQEVLAAIGKDWNITDSTAAATISEAQALKRSRDRFQKDEVWDVLPAGLAEMYGGDAFLRKPSQEDPELPGGLIVRPPRMAELMNGEDPDAFVMEMPAAAERLFPTPPVMSKTIFSGDLAELLSSGVASAGNVAGTTASGLFSTLGDTWHGLTPAAKGTLATLGVLGVGALGGKVLSRTAQTRAITSAIRNNNNGGSSTRGSDVVDVHGASLTSNDVAQLQAAGYAPTGEPLSACVSVLSTAQVPVGFWRTIYQIGDAYDARSALPSFGFMAGDPEVAISGIKSPLLFVDGEGVLHRTPAPYAVPILAGGIFKKIRKAIKKVTSKVSSVVKKIADNPLVKGIASVIPGGSLMVSAAGKVAGLASKLTSSSPKTTSSAVSDQAKPMTAVTSSGGAAQVVDNTASVRTPGGSIAAPAPTMVTDAKIRAYPEPGQSGVLSATADVVGKSASGAIIPAAWQTPIQRMGLPQSLEQRVLEVAEREGAPLEGWAFVIPAASTAIKWLAWTAGPIVLDAAVKYGSKLVGSRGVAVAAKAATSLKSTAFWKSLGNVFARITPYARSGASGAIKIGTWAESGVWAVLSSPVKSLKVAAGVAGSGFLVSCWLNGQKSADGDDMAVYDALAASTPLPEDGEYLRARRSRMKSVISGESADKVFSQEEMDMINMIGTTTAIYVLSKETDLSDDERLVLQTYEASAKALDACDPEAYAAVLAGTNAELQRLAQEAMIADDISRSEASADPVSASLGGPTGSSSLTSADIAATTPALAAAALGATALGSASATKGDGSDESLSALNDPDTQAAVLKAYQESEDQEQFKQKLLAYGIPATALAAIVALFATKWGRDKVVAFTNFWNDLFRDMPEVVSSINIKA